MIETVGCRFFMEALDGEDVSIGGGRTRKLSRDVQCLLQRVAPVSAASCSQTARHLHETATPCRQRSASRGESLGPSTLATSIQVTCTLYTWCACFACPLHAVFAFPFLFALLGTQHPRSTLTNTFFRVFVFKASYFSLTAAMFQAVLGLARAFFDPSGEQEALGIVCQRLVRFDGVSSWTK